MARPTKEQAGQYRLPTWHAGSMRWRLRIEHAHGTKTFYWPAEAQTPTPPPKVIAASVAAQDQWKALVDDWFWIGPAMKIDQPEQDWSRPAWVDRAKAQAVVDRLRAERQKERQETRCSVLHHVALNGVQDLIATASEPGALAVGGRDSETLAAKRPDLLMSINSEREGMRLQVLAELAHARSLISTATVLEALRAYLEYHYNRTKLKFGDWIEQDTYLVLRRKLLAAFGLSSSAEMNVIREVPLELSARLASLDQDALEGLARYWHAMPAGIGSERTVKGVLEEARAFFRWCERKYRGFAFPHDVARLYTAANVKTPAEPYDAERIGRIIAQGKARGGERLKMYTFLGLLLGYGQTDCTEIAEDEYFVEGADHFIKRFRSKEHRPKRGSRPLKVKHWVPPELAAMIDCNRGVNPQGYLFNSERGTVLTPNAVSQLWERAVEAANDTLAFKQLRKMGYNRIKHHAGSREVAELWDGHSGGIADHYDDGIFVPVIEAQRRFAAELREQGIL